MPKKTKVFTPENMQIIADLRAKKVPAVKIAKILGVSLSALARNVAKHDLPRQKKKTKAKPFVVAQYVHKTGAAPISLEEMAARPKAQTITERRTVAYAPTMPEVDFALADLASKGPRHLGYAQIGEIRSNPFRLKARVSEFNRDRRAILEEIEGEIDKVFRKFRTLAGPNTRIEDAEIFKLLSADARAVYDHLQALIAAARVLREANGVIVEAAIHLHDAGAAATRATA